MFYKMSFYETYWKVIIKNIICKLKIHIWTLKNLSKKEKNCKLKYNYTGIYKDKKFFKCYMKKKKYKNIIKIEKNKNKLLITAYSTTHNKKNRE